MTRHVENPYFDPCYWDNEKNLVKTNYLDSRFVLIPNADNLYDELHNTLQSLPEKNMLNCLWMSQIPIGNFWIVI